MYKENPEHYKEVLKEKIRAEHERRNYTYSNENTVSYGHFKTAGDKISYEAGLKYINENIRPYRNSVEMGIKGARIMATEKAAREKAEELTKSVINSFARAAGLGEIAGVNPYIRVISLMKSGLTGLSQGQEDRSR